MINNNFERIQDLIFLFRIPVGMTKNFFEIYGKFGNERSESFASPATRHTF
jgi:hypothetical protein